MDFYILQSPVRDTSSLRKIILEKGHNLIIQKAIWISEMDPDEISQFRENQFVERKASLQIGDRAINLQEMACAVSHHLIYKQAAKSFSANPNLEWVVVLEDDVIVFNEFSLRIEVLSKIKFGTPTVISLFTRGKRYACKEKFFRERSDSTLLKAYVPPGQTCFYMINRQAVNLAISNDVAEGEADWPFWSEKCNFFLSYPWVGIETQSGTTIPTPGPASRIKAYFFIIQVFSFIKYRSWREHDLNAKSYFRFMIKPLLLRVLLRMHYLRPLNTQDKNSPFVPWYQL